MTEEVYDRLMAAHILEISLYPADEESGEEPETLAINVPEDKVKAAFREHMTHHFLDKQVEEDIVNEKDEVLAKAGDKFTADVIEKILEDGTVKELKIRNNEVDGVYVEAITSGKTRARCWNLSVTVWWAVPWPKTLLTKTARSSTISTTTSPKTWPM